MSRNRERSNQIERHPERLSIELARLKGLSLDRISERWGVHRDAVARHMAKLDPDYRAALAADVPLSELAERAAQEGGSLLDNLAVLRSGLMTAAVQAKAAGDNYAYSSLARVALEVIRESGKFTGEMVNAPSVQNITNNVAILMRHPVMHQMQAMLADRLAPYPEALHAVMVGLSELEQQHAPPRMIDATAA